MTADKQRGFTLIEVLLSVIALSVVVFVGYYVYNQSSSNDKSAASSTTAKPLTPLKKVKPADPTASWTAYTTTGNGFSFKYPSGWTKNVCDANFVLLGPSPDAAGHCQSDATAQIVLSSVKGDNRTTAKLEAASFPDLKSEAVTVDGIAGVKETGTLQASGEQFVGPTNGSKLINYVFYTNDTTYIMLYVQIPAFTDVSSDFNLLVTNTLKFIK